MKLLPLTLTLTSAILLALVPAVADDGPILKRDISKTPAWETEHAALKALPVYVPPQASDGTLLEPIIVDFQDVDADAEGNETFSDVEDVTLEYVRPLIAFYTDGPVEGIDEDGYGGFPGHGERDAFGAVSLDDGATWSRTNLSNSASESSFKIRLGGRQKVAYPGDVGRTFIASDGNQVLAVWVSRYVGGGNPNYAMTDDERTAVADYLFGEGTDAAEACTDGDLIETPCLYLEDHFSVAGSQGSSDLADEGLPLVGELPYAAVWTARGVLLPPDENTGDDVGTGEESSTFVWFKAERLSSAVRDANRPEVACAKGAGCAITWQEDPDGIRPGEGEGPGEGWSGAIAHHQTDTWYSYIDWDDFSLVSEDGSYGLLLNDTGSLADWVVANDTGRPKAAIPLSIPVRLTDNAMCVAENPDTGEADKPYCYADFDGSGTADFCADYVSVTIETPEGPTSDVNMCITEDGRLMRGNTASTRARINLHEYSSTEPFVFGAEDNSAFFNSIDSAWFSVSYEENKGLGEDGEALEVSEDPADKIDMGKNVWYHTFDMFNPELVSQGLMLNQPAVYPDDFSDTLELLTQDTSLGYNFWTIDPDPIYETQAVIDTTLYQTEISRRPSPISQDFYNVGETGTVAFQLWKQGVIRRGGPADIMGRRFVIDFTIFDSTVDNPYAYENMECETWAFTDQVTEPNPRYVKGFCASPADNVSANTITLGECGDNAAVCRDVFPFSEYFDDLDMTLATDGLSKIFEWVQLGPGYGDELVPDETLDGNTNFDDPTWENPYDVAKGHRGFLNGDMLMVMYAWSPNWMANTVGHDNYNLYNRRSFDGGETWSTTPAEYGGDGTTTCEWMGPAGTSTEEAECTDYGAGDFEKARNVSQLVGTQVTILDPRYSPTPPAITEGSVSTPSLPEGFEAPLYDDDIRNPSTYFMVYETGDNTTVAVGEAEPLDLFYSRAINWGDDYQVWGDEGELDTECLPGTTLDENFGSFCNEFDALEGSHFDESGEASVTTNPSGRFFYAVWNQIDFDLDGHELGSDAWFRRVLYWYTPEYTIPTFDFPTPIVDNPPTIMIVSPADGDEFDVSTTIMFSGTAGDVEDGPLGDSIVWTSNIDGIIGTGADISVLLSVGTHTITAEVTDDDENTVSDSITITVEDGTPVNVPPTVSITSPANDATFASGATISFSASASDFEDGDLSFGIVWRDNGTEFGPGGSGFSAVLSDGPHTITAEVTDSGTLTAIATVTITVEPATPGEFSAAVTTPLEIYYKGDTVRVEVAVTDDDGAAVDGAAVTILITFPDINVTRTLVTDAGGLAAVGYKINTRKTGTGLVDVTVSVTKEGYGDYTVTELSMFQVQ